MDSYFAVTAPGLEPFAQQELSSLNLLPAHDSDHQHSSLSIPHSAFIIPNSSFRIHHSAGGIEFRGDLTALYRANLHLRTASRILARLGNFFHATTFDELRQRAARLPWERFIAPAQPVCLRVTCHKSKLYHSDAVARTVLAALAERLGKPSPALKADEESDRPPQLVVVRLANDQCTVSVDSSGTILHKRGYRQAVAKAPLRETLAAAMLMASGWDRAAPLLDPFCGSGTIPIEAALMALGIPPGSKRRFAFMDWPNFDENLWQSIQIPLTINHPPTPPILASDRDAGAVKMARENAERAGVADFIEFKQQAVSSITPPPGPGWIVTNPPYGRRVSQGKDLRNLYAQLGNILREKCHGWNLSVLCSEPALIGQIKVEMDTSLGLTNGGIYAKLARGKVL